MTTARCRRAQARRATRNDTVSSARPPPRPSTRPSTRRITSFLPSPGGASSPPPATAPGRGSGLRRSAADAAQPPRCCFVSTAVAPGAGSATMPPPSISGPSPSVVTLLAPSWSGLAPSGAQASQLDALPACVTQAGAPPSTGPATHSVTRLQGHTGGRRGKQLLVAVATPPQGHRTQETRRRWEQPRTHLPDQRAVSSHTQGRPVVAPTRPSRAAHGASRASRERHTPAVPARTSASMQS